MNLTPSRLKKVILEVLEEEERTPAGNVTASQRAKSATLPDKEGTKTKLIRFGQQGVTTAGKKTDKKSKARRKSFKARHAKNIKRGKMSAA